MSSTCDATTAQILSKTIGTRLFGVAARRYPGYLAYSEIVMALAGEHSIRVDLCAELIAPKFEVFVVRARECTRHTSNNEWDRIELGDFTVAKVFLLRRKEWIEQVVEADHAVVGRHPVEQRFGQLNEKGNVSGSVIVDSGVCFLSELGAEMCLDADVFPLTFQLQYRVAPSPLPQGTRISIDAWKERQ